MKTIDAKNKKIGRVASVAARMLMGKDEPTYKANVLSKIKVQITNASKAKITQKKMREKVYTKYSGHPGGIKRQTLEEVVTKKGHAEAFRKAIYGMLPNNRLRKERMKNLDILE